MRRRNHIFLWIFRRDQPTERQVRIQLKDHIDRCKKRKQDNSVREEYKYSGSEGEEEENAIAGEPSSIVHNAAAHQGGDTLRRNFQQIQEGRWVHFLWSSTTSVFLYGKWSWWNWHQCKGVFKTLTFCSAYVLIHIIYSRENDERAFESMQKVMYNQS